MKLSIIVPVYKVERYLRRCVDSILAQTFTDFELILVNDGSPDGCPGICDEYAQKDQRIKVIHKENGGLSDARNAGLNIAQGEYIGFVESDDWIHPEMYERLINTALMTKADITECKHKETSEDISYSHLPEFNIDEISVYNSMELIRQLYPSMFINDYSPNVWSKVYKRKVFSELRFPKDRIFEDWYVQLPALCHAERIAIMPYELYYYRIQRPGSIMNSEYRFAWALDANAVCNNNLRIFQELGETEQYQYQLDEYLVRFFRDYYAVRFEHKEYKEQFKPIQKELNGRFWRLLTCSKICKMSKIMLVLLYINPRWSLKIAKKYMPHCVYSFMR